MSELKNSEFEYLRDNLVIGNCPNCGFAGTQDVSHLVGSISSVCEQRVDMIDVVMVICPNCGHISFFKKSDVLKGHGE